jgi:nitric oxide reductase NorE protein
MTVDDRVRDASPPDLPEFLRAADEEPSSRVSVDAVSTTAGRIPGEVGLWIFILGDMIVFGAILIVLMREYRSQHGLFAESANRLLPAIGVINTLVLLLSSYLVVCGVHAHRQGLHHRTVPFVTGAIGCAAVFVALKATEYSREILDGATPTANLFFTYYFALTGLHLVHVLVGSALLTAWCVMARRQRPWQQSRITVEGIAVYWHMVDLLWIAIFTLVYLVCAH